jgi:hypothetical protein
MCVFSFQGLAVRILDFELTDEQKMIVKAASELAEDFGPEYWREEVPYSYLN